ncbi:MAG: smalltalk protein [Prevotella sp.]|nr:smalltalk protein [Prevotella sp.]
MKKKETIKYIIQLIVAILTAIGSTITVVSCANGHVGEGFALLGGTIIGTGWLHNFSTLL